MFVYILKRILLMVPTLLGALTITFVVMQFVPGGPVEQAIAEARANASGGADGYRAGRDLDKKQIEELKKNFTGSKLAIKGTVSAYRKAWSPTAPNITTLEAEGGKLEVVFWTNEGQPFPTGADTTGQLLYVSGTLKEHKERLQLQVSNNANVRTEPLPPETRAVPALYVETVNPVKKESSEE